MQLPTQKKRLSQRRIPTIIGLLILVTSLAAGAFFFRDGLGVFAPRATPETTPQKIRVTNVTDNGFTVSFITEEQTPAFVKYGSSEEDLDSQSSDDRDQLSGTINAYNTHHITVRGLEENSAYYYVLGTGSGSTFDNNGSPFTITTAQKSGVPSAAKTIYGTILNESNTPAEDVIVYISLEGAGEMSSLVRKSGSWAVPLSNARTVDKSGYATLTDNDQVNIFAQGKNVSSTSQHAVLVSEAQPVPTLTLGKNGAGSTADSTTADDTTTPTPSPETSTEPIAPVTEASSSNPGALGGLLTESVDLESSAEQNVVNVDNPFHQNITTTQPIISGEAPPNITIKIEVNSETQIIQQLVTNPDGSYSLDLKSLGQSLEPGEHTVTVTYTDPASGDVISETVTFTIAGATAQLAQANNGSNEPFGTGNPFPGSPTPSATASASPAATASATPAASASATPTATGSAGTKGSQPATSEALPESGSVGTTMALVFGGLFFIISGIWSFWIAQELREDEVIVEL